MPISENITDRYEVRVYAPTASRAKWRVNVTDVETGAQGRAFFSSERLARATAATIAEPMVADLFGLA